MAEEFVGRGETRRVRETNRDSKSELADCVEWARYYFRRENREREDVRVLVSRVYKHSKERREKSRRRADGDRVSADERVGDADSRRGFEVWERGGVLFRSRVRRRE